MRRKFSRKNARNLANYFQNAVSQLTSIQRNIEVSKAQVEEAVTSMASTAAYEKMKSMPVEDLNRNKNGIRAKALREHGYINLGQLIGIEADELADLRGISKDNADKITAQVYKIQGNLQKDFKIRINSDYRTRQADELVCAIYKYNHLKPLSKSVDRFFQEDKEDIRENLELMKPATAGFLNWLLTPDWKREAANSAYNYLYKFRESTFKDEADSIISKFNSGIGTIDTETAWDDYIKNPIAYINTLEEITPGYIGGNDAYYGLSDDLAEDIQNESINLEGLKCQLRPYQVWGVKYILRQKNALLGDEMGLGKTIEAIATMVSLKNSGETHFIVVCPASVLTNWCREVMKQSPLDVIKVHGAGRYHAIDEWMNNGGVAVTTYETTSYFELPDDYRFSLLIVDEAHYIKNEETNRSRNVRKLCKHADRLLFMTGTALENKVSEMVSLVNVLQPEIGDAIKGLEDLADAPTFRKEIAPVYYRRKRDDVLTELPDKIESWEWCTLNSGEKEAYENAILGEDFMRARRVSWDVDDLNESCKAQRLKEIVRQATDDNRKIIAFSFFLATLSKVKQLFGDKCLGPISGSVSPKTRQEIIDQFEEASPGTVLAAQIQSGGTGLNIQAASVVVICEPQFKPSTENQAISRAYRMGQTRDVLVYRLLCENTLEERMTMLLEEKQKIFDEFADKSEAAQNSMNLSETKFKELIEEERARIKKEKGIVETSAEQAEKE